MILGWLIVLISTNVVKDYFLGIDLKKKMKEQYTKVKVCVGLILDITLPEYFHANFTLKSCVLNKSYWDGSYMVLTKL